MPEHSKRTIKDGKLIVTTEKDLSHVVAGYKATLSSPRTSLEAKSNAKARLDELKGAMHVKDPAHIVGGLKAALANEHVHEDTKVEIRERLASMGVEDA